MSKDFGAAGFSFRLRTQFSFYADDPLLAGVLSRISDRQISITGFMQTKLLETGAAEYARSIHPLGLNLVRLVVGTPDGETARDLAGVRSILDALGVKYQEKSILQMLGVAPGTVGVISETFGALWCKVTVNAFYLGEGTVNFIDVSDVCKALKILSEEPLEVCARLCRMEDEI